VPSATTWTPTPPPTPNPKSTNLSQELVAGHLYDLGATFTAQEGRPDADELIAAWVEGYRRVAPLPAEDEREIWTFLMLRRLLVSAFASLRSDTELAAELEAAGYTEESCRIAETYLSRFG
jgi:Ser/Thr protein kinase RdoA (MazF antagonist)